MPSNRPRPTKTSSLAKEVSVLAWIQDAYGQVLVVRQRAGKQLWSLPGGKVRRMEPLRQALRREIREEIGLTVESEEIIDLFDRPKKAAVAVLFKVSLRRGRLKLSAREILDARFTDKLPPQATPSVRYFWRRQWPLVAARRRSAG